MNFSDDDYAPLLDDAIFYMYRYVGTVIYILGNMGNVLTAVIFAKKTWRKNICVFYFNYCLIINSIFLNTYILATILIEGFSIQAHHNNVLLCKLYYYSSSVFGTLLPSILISASIDRLLITSRNIETRLYSSKRLAYLSVSICTLVWMIFYIHLLIKSNVHQIGPSTFQCFYDLSQTYLEFISAWFLIITCSFCLTMIILSKLALKNIRYHRPVPRTQRKQMRTMTKKDFQLLHCLFVYDLVYIVCTILLSFYYVYLVSRFDQVQTPLEQVIDNFLEKLLDLIRFIPFCISFGIFSTFSKVFRHELLRMIYQRFSRTPMAQREEENRPEIIEKDSAHVDVVSTL